MTAASHGPEPNISSILSPDGNGLYRTRREPFIFSLLGQGAIVGLLIYFLNCVISHPPDVGARLPHLKDLPLIFSGRNGGGGGDHNLLPASRGNLPRSSLDAQLVPPTVILPKEMPRLPVDPTIIVEPEIRLPQGGQTADPMSQFVQTLSNGPGGPGGIGIGCCDGVGSSSGPGFGSGPEGIYPTGKMVVTVPQVIYSPEPSFSDEARKSKTQGVVTLLLIVGKDGRAYNIRVGQSLGMGLDEKAIEAVNRWRFKPATLNGQPVATQIAVEVDFHLY